MEHGINYHWVCYGRREAFLVEGNGKIYFHSGSD
jgi:hypothetical protein